ncbi:MAG: cytochrome c biogenesis heme-transporting ATPase CcmA [Granulosicoccus sp.]
MSKDTDLLLEARAMTIWRGDNLLMDEIDVEVRAGSILQIQGTNGSGKTTLLRAMIGLAEFDEGEVLWCGQPFLKVRDALYAELLYLSHKPGISPGLTPLENIKALCPELGADCRGVVESVLAELSIADRIDLPSAALSAGQKRRITLARLRLQAARLWVLDEPLTSLDKNGYDWVRQEIQRHVGLGGAVVFTTHQALSFDPLPVHSIVLGGDS